MRSNEKIKNIYFLELQKDYKAQLAKESTIAQRKKAVTYFVNFLNDREISLNQLSEDHIHEFLQFISQKITQRGTRFAPATIKQMNALIKSFYRFFYRSKKGKVTHPDLIFTREQLKRYKTSERKLPKYIDQEKMRLLLEECPQEWKALFHFMYDTGSRISEVLNIRLSDIDFDKRRVEIHEPKTMNVRVTVLSKDTIQLIKDYLTKRRNPIRGHEPYIFISKQRRKLSPRTVQYVVKKESTRILGRKHVISPHYFRAACAVHLLERGVDIRQVQEIIGWKSLAVVQNYTRVTIQRQSQLKEQFHPGFGSKDEEKRKTDIDLSKILKQNEIMIHQLSEQLRHQQAEQQRYQQAEQQRHQQEIKELIIEYQRKQEEQEKRLRCEFEQERKKFLETQQQLIQLLSQKNVNK